MAELSRHLQPRAVPDQARGAPEITVVVPTFNERANVARLVERLAAALDGYAWEVVFVDDDSPDGTAEAVRDAARRDYRVRSVQRIGRRGLASACIEGMLSSSAPLLAVIDGDLQHDETLLPRMIESLRDPHIDIVVGSRYADGGSIGDWAESRAAISRLATRLSRLVVRQRLSDPMSGFFLVRATVFRDAVRSMSGVGFKVLLDLFASSPEPLRCIELPYEFRARGAGESKLDSQAAWEYGMLLLDKLVGHIVPVRFVAFTLVGALGLVIHLTTQALLFKGAELAFVTSQAIATLVAMTFNFALNNALTYRDLQLHGWKWLRGWLSFSLACGVGAIANVGIASYIFSLNTRWFLAAIAGILVGAVWNYAVTRVYTWKAPKR